MPDRSGFVDSLLFDLLVSAHHDAERAYLDAVIRGPYPDRLDGVAEGLAVAVNLLGGDHPAVVRARAAAAIDAERRAEQVERSRSSDALRRLRAARELAATSET